MEGADTRKKTRPNKKPRSVADAGSAVLIDASLRKQLPSRPEPWGRRHKVVRKALEEGTGHISRLHCSGSGCRPQPEIPRKRGMGAHGSSDESYSLLVIVILILIPQSSPIRLVDGALLMHTIRGCAADQSDQRNGRRSPVQLAMDCQSLGQELHYLVGPSDKSDRLLIDSQLLMIKTGIHGRQYTITCMVKARLRQITIKITIRIRNNPHQNCHAP